MPMLLAPPLEVVQIQSMRLLTVWIQPMRSPAVRIQPRGPWEFDTCPIGLGNSIRRVFCVHIAFLLSKASCCTLVHTAAPETVLSSSPANKQELSSEVQTEKVHVNTNLSAEYLWVLVKGKRGLCYHFCIPSFSTHESCTYRKIHRDYPRLKGEWSDL